MTGILAALEQWPAVVALRNSTIAYPLVNAAHVVGVALLFGAIVPLDLRLAGWRRFDGPAETLARVLVPVAVFGLALAVVAGLLLFATDASAYAASALFRIKMACILAALVNVAAFRRTGWSGRGAAIAGSLSVGLWLAVIVLGRLVGYF